MGKKTEINVENMLLCIIVILIHCFGDGVTRIKPAYNSYAVLSVVHRLSSFAVQGFIFLSAMKLFMNKREENYLTFIKKRVCTVLVPYLIWAVIYYVYKACFYEYNWSVQKVILSILNGHVHAHFYFVIIIMQFYLLMPLWKWIFKKENAVIAIPVCIFLSAAFHQSFYVMKSIFGIKTYFHDRICLTYLSYWCIGAYVGLSYDKFKAALKKTIPFYAPILAIFAFLCSVAVLKSNIEGEYIAGSETVFYAYAIAAIFATFALSIYLSRFSVFESKLFLAINKVSYRIYIIHPLVLLTFNLFFNPKKLAVTVSFNILRFLCVTVVSFALAYLIGLLTDCVKKIIGSKIKEMQKKNETGLDNGECA